MRTPIIKILSILIKVSTYFLSALVTVKLGMSRGTKPLDMPGDDQLELIQDPLTHGVEYEKPDSSDAVRKGPKSLSLSVVKTRKRKAKKV